MSDQIFNLVEQHYNHFNVKQCSVEIICTNDQAQCTENSYKLQGQLTTCTTGSNNDTRLVKHKCYIFSLHAGKSPQNQQTKQQYRLNYKHYHQSVLQCAGSIHMCDFRGHLYPLLKFLKSFFFVWLAIVTISQLIKHTCNLVVNVLHEEGRQKQTLFLDSPLMMFWNSHLMPYLTPGIPCLEVIGQEVRLKERQL